MSLKNHKLHISDKHKSIIINTIKTVCPDNSVWAYGSRMGEDNDIYAGTDLDLVVLGENPAINELKKSFAECNVPYNIDVVAMNSIPDSFKCEIKKKYVILY